MTTEEINGEYEYETGEVIIKTFEARDLNPMQVPACWCTPTARLPGAKTRRCGAQRGGAGRVRLYGPVLPPTGAAAAGYAV
jgi:hypothetical protein